MNCYFYNLLTICPMRSVVHGSRLFASIAATMNYEQSTMNCRSLIMIRFPFYNGKGTVQLFNKKQAHHLMRKSHS
jgi:hypothetical protein